MFVLVETFQSHNDIGNRTLGTYDSIVDARKAMLGAQDLFYHSVSRDDYDRFSYKTGGRGRRMAWCDVVCANDTFGHTWTIFDTNMRNVTMSRYLG